MDAVPALAWGAVFYATVFSLVLAYLLWTERSGRGGYPHGDYMCVTPLIAVGSAWLMLGEQPRRCRASGRDDHRGGAAGAEVRRRGEK